MTTVLARAPADDSTLIRGMFHRQSAKPQPGMGVLPPDWLESTFTMNWKIAAVGQWVSFEPGEPVCMVMPYDARLLNKTRVEQKMPEEAPKRLRERFMAWQAARGAHLADGDTAVRDRLYLQGKCPITKLKMAKDHILKLSLKKFTD